ncbi:hypothetical protein QYE76_045287 [Lolium multiflorum]|uniref:Reverse transcriptase n=1 Tax=Lolium multiflorum TaxID=4521 RepID=A0AAD8WXX4_LOLMU|nr:hypothetical protein QYE76_045287 [Lolium multiflorum]
MGTIRHARYLRELAEHVLNVDPNAKPVKHKLAVSRTQSIGKNIEVYIDDIIVKSRDGATLIDDLRQTFDNLDRYNIKMNPKKCFFGVFGGQVLGYFISARGIEAKPVKIKAILDMEPPKTYSRYNNWRVG